MVDRDPDSRKCHHVVTLASENVAHYSRGHIHEKLTPTFTCLKPEGAHFIPIYGVLSRMVTQALLTARELGHVEKHMDIGDQYMSLSTHPQDHVSHGWMI